jgi:hypothetical protein
MFEKKAKRSWGCVMVSWIVSKICLKRAERSFVEVEEVRKMIVKEQTKSEKQPKEALGTVRLR